MRARRLLLLSVVVTAAPILLWSVAAAEQTGRPIGTASGSVSDGPRTPEARALAVLRRWDVRRARAWSAGDPAALARLYVPGSRTGAHDTADLRRWVGRGLRVTGMHAQVASVVLSRRSLHRMILRVVDRTVDGVAVGNGRRTSVPASPWATHRIVLRRGGGSWRVVEVTQPAR
jgi:hypothetical protein